LFRVLHFGFRDFARTWTSLLLLKRPFYELTAAFGGVCGIGGVMIPLGWVRLFLGGFSVRVVGQEFGVVFGFTERLWQLFDVSFSGEKLPRGGFRLFLYGFRVGAGFGSGATATGATEASSGLDTSNSG
jgi:hypothetical protein